MTSPQTDLLELAKQGDAKAITTLLNRSLQPKGITAKAGLKESCLQIFLESIQLPDQQLLMSFIRRGIETIKPKSVRTVKVYGRLKGADFPVWTDEFQLPDAESFLVDFVPETIDSSPAGQELSPPVLPESPTASAPRRQPPAADPTHTYRSTRQTANNDKGLEALQDIRDGLRAFATNPVGGLSALYDSIGKRRSLVVGIAFALFYILCLLFIMNKVATSFSFYSGATLSFLQIFILGAVQFISIAGASALTRLVFRASGSPEGDLLISGASLLAPGFLMLASSILGFINIEIIVILFTLAVTYTILVLYGGCHRISKISEGMSPLAVVLIMLLSTWLSKIIVTAGR